MEDPRNKDIDESGIPIYAMPDKRPRSGEDTMGNRSSGDASKDLNSALYAQVDKRLK